MGTTRRRCRTLARWFETPMENLYFGKRVTVTGHFDDPAASTCRSTAALETEPPAPEFVVLGCRTAFVVTDIQPR